MNVQNHADNTQSADSIYESWYRLPKYWQLLVAEMDLIVSIQPASRQKKVLNSRKNDFIYQEEKDPPFAVAKVADSYEIICIDSFDREFNPIDDELRLITPTEQIQINFMRACAACLADKFPAILKWLANNGDKNQSIEENRRFFIHAFPYYSVRGYCRFLDCDKNPDTLLINLAGQVESRNDF